MGSKNRASAGQVRRRAFFRGLTAGSVAMAGTGLLTDSIKVVASAAGPSITPTGGELDAIVKEGTLRVGIFLQYPPLQFRNPKTRTPEGFDVDLANLLAKDLGVKLDLVDMEWNSLIP